MNRKKHSETVKNMIEFHFGEYYRRWNEAGLDDDRNIFVAMYDQLTEAADAMSKVDNSFVWIAFREKMKEQEKTMCEIVKRFTGNYPVYGMGSVYDPAQL